jgi:hypothetical protein
MYCPRLLLAAMVPAAAALAIGLMSSSAQSPPAAPAEAEVPTPYQPVAIKLAEPYGDTSFATFRQELADVAQRRIFANLERMVVTPGFFWERDFGAAYDAKRSAGENLAAAIGLEHNDGAGWQWLADIAAEAGATPMPSRPGVVCAPAPPLFDAFEFDRLLESTHSARRAWVFPRAGSAEMRVQRHERSAIAGTIGLHFVRLLGFEPRGDDADAARTAWTRVAMPDGKTGYVAPGKLAALDPAQLCYVKDALGRWRVAGFVGAGD